MKTFEIWSEGYRATCEHGTAVCLGEFQAETFQGAVAQLAQQAKHRQYVDLKNLTYWGCGLHDNEADARKTYG